MAEMERRESTSRQRFLTMVPRHIDENWKCQQSGDCCSPGSITMTREEMIALQFHAPAEIKLTFVPDETPGFVRMTGLSPCPLFIFNGCIAYSHRPYNCRRFACMRPDPKTEPLDLSGPLGCNNLSERIASSRAVRRLYLKIQRKAQRWAMKHGWNVKDPEE